MWNDEEDNNPYGDSETVESRFERASTPPSEGSSPGRDSPTFVSRPQDLSDEEPEHVSAGDENAQRKKGGYDSRVEQLLCEQDDLVITITQAGKNSEGGGSYIAYTIRTGDFEVRRRYSDFYSLRQTLVNLHPTLIVPPIPEKHSMADYAAKPTKAKEDEAIIEHRKRMLASFLNRCKRMKHVREDGIFWKFLDPNASWNEVLHSPPVSTLPKSNLRVPPLDPTNPSPGHNYLPIPSATAKLKSSKDGSPSGTPTSPPPSSTYASSAAHTATGPAIFGKFPPSARELSEAELDPYFVQFETSSRDLETLLSGNMEKVNRRTLSHLTALSADLMDLGGGLNGFSLSEQSQTLAAALEKMGQAADSTYIATSDLASSLGASFSEPMRESAQFASIVRSVLRYRILKRIQGEMTRDELQKKKTLLNQLEQSELEAKRIEQHLQSSGFGPGSPQRRATSSGRSSQERARAEEDTASIDSDFPPGHGDAAPSAAQGQSEPTSPSGTHKKNASSGNFVTNKIFGRINHAIHGIVDVDPERTRRDQMGKTKESLLQLEQALEVSDKDVKDASAGVLSSMKEFQAEKEEDLKKYMLAYARCHIDWAKRNLAAWEDAKSEVENIDVRRPSSDTDFSRSIFTADDDEQTSVTSPRSAAQSPSPAPSYNSPTTPRYLPPHLHDEIADAAAAAAGTHRRSSIGSLSDTSRRSPSISLPGEQLMTNSEPPGLPQSAGNGPSSSEHTGNHSVSFAEADLSNLGLHARSSSPAKRSRSQRDTSDDEDARQDTSRMDIDGSESTARSPKKAFSVQHVSPMPNRSKNMSADSSRMAATMLGGTNTKQEPSGSEGSVGSHAEAEMSTVSPDSTPPTSVATTDTGTTSSAPTAKPPSYDEQVRIVKELVNKQEQKEGVKGYVISSSWLARVQSRTTQGLHEQFLKSAREGDVGPVDNSPLARNDNFYPPLCHANGEKFIPLKSGLQMSTDLEIVPEDAWQLVMKWYGVAEDSHVIIRYMHNTSPDSHADNFQYELYPPILTIQKLPGKEEFDLQTMKEKTQDAPHLVATRSEGFQHLLKRAKEAAGVDIGTKVQVWKVLETEEARDRFSAMPTPVASRSASPAPVSTMARVKPKLVVDMNAFTAMPEGNEREILDIKDETANDKYNGHVDLGTIGFPESQTLILEEQVRGSSGEEFPSEKLRKTAEQNGVSLTVTKAAGVGADTARQKQNAGSARRSPTPSGMMTRGRANRKGKPKGCTGLVNLGNTCYMNSALQCIRSVEELTIYFLQQKWKEELNSDNPLGHNGSIAKVYAGLLGSIYDSTALGSFSPRNFKGVLGRCQPLFSGYGQQDSQEFLSFLVDGLHEDLNRILKKPYMENPESDDNTVNDPQAIMALGEKFRSNYRARNDSVAMDLFNGFYKNTMVCPVCDKVSITFDPYSLLTLQLPIESTFQHTVIYAPLHGLPTRVEVDIDKNSTIRAIKEYVSKRIGSPPVDNMVMAEIYNNKFFKLFEDAEVVSEANIQSNDVLVCYELDMAPTNWPPHDKKKNRLGLLSHNSSNDDAVPEVDSSYADCMAVPVTSRVKGTGRTPFRLWPFFVMITRKEARDIDAILRKILQRVSTMTSKDILMDESQPGFSNDTRATPDTINGIDEDESSSDEPQVQAKSVEGDDDLVDVSMSEDKSDAQPKSNYASRPHSSVVLDPSYFVRPELRRLFTMSYFASPSEMVPCGYSTVTDTMKLSTLESRVPQSPSRRASNSSRRGRVTGGNASESSEDELAKGDTHMETSDRVNQTIESEDESDAVSRPMRLKKGFNKFRNTYSRKNRQASNSSDEYLIRLGEGIILDWDQDGFDALFSGDADDDMRGHGVESDMETLPDPELTEKKARRAARKKSGISLDECFDETGKTEILSEENAWYCSRCKELRRASKTLEIWTVPDILVVHLKRFSSNSRLRDKIDVLVDFPTEGLDLAGRVGLPEDKSLVYDLFAVDNHYGGLGGGHYTAYAQNFYDRKWYEYNDQSVSQSSAEQSVTRAAYLLFYRRRSETPLGPPYLQELVNKANASDSESGDDQRLDGSNSPNGPSSTGLTAGVGADLQQDGLNHGSIGGHLDLETTARSALNNDDAPPPYDDEGISMDDPDNPLPSFETDQPFIGPLAPGRYESGWGFDRLNQGRDRDFNDAFDSVLVQGTVAPPGSDNGMADDDSTTLADNDSNEPNVGDGPDERSIADLDDDDDFGGQFSSRPPGSPVGYEEDDGERMSHVVQIGLLGEDSEGEVADIKVSDEESANAWDSVR